MGGVTNEVSQAVIRSLSEGISRLHDTQCFSDTTVEVYGIPFRCHRLILEAMSPVFKNMFVGQKEKFSINQKDVTIMGFEILLHFLYKGTLKKYNEDQKERIIEAYFAGAYFQIASLKAKCITEIASWVITTDNVFKLLDKGYEIEELRNRCLNFIRLHPVEVITSPCFETASVKCISIILEIDAIRQNVPALLRIKHVMEWGMATFPSSATPVLDRNSYDYINVRQFLFENVSFTQNLRLLSILDYHQLTATELPTVVTYENLLTAEEVTCMLKYIARSNPQDLPDWCREATDSVMANQSVSQRPNNSSQSKIRQFKLVVLGESGVGKSNLVLRFVKGQFDEYRECNIGAEFYTHTVCSDDTTVKFEIFDTVGQERWRSLAPTYYRGAQAAIVVYDITCQDTFSTAKTWVKELQRQASPNIVIALAGNKADLSNKRDVEYEEAQAYADENGLLFMETSAWTAMNVNNIFLATDLRNQVT